VSDLGDLARSVIDDFITKNFPQVNRAAWLTMVPLDPNNGWHLTETTWRVSARHMVDAFANRLGETLAATGSELDELGTMPLQMFADYLVNLGIEALAERSAPIHVDVGISSLAMKVLRTVDRSVLYRVWFGTNRMPNDSNDVGKGFSGGRTNTIRYGRCDVFVPESHQIGSIGSSVLRRLLTRTDDRLKIHGTVEAAAADMWSGLQTQLASAQPGRRHAVVFIHGYNVSFEEAALRAAQMGFDLGVEAMAFFSWPSKGTLQGYLADGSSIEASENAITNFLVSFANNVDAEAIHVIAHSMGNRGVLRAVNQIAARAELRAGKRFDQFVLAAADVDADTFRALAKAYSEVSRRTTLYVSSRDRALSLSSFLSDYARIGFWPPVAIVPGIDTVSVSDVDLSQLGHGYVAEARDVLGDLHQLLFTGLPPERRFSVREAKTDADERYWTIRR
jgi:esterase/lipase superfamily enzyme